MKTLVQAFESYLGEVAGLEVQLHPEPVGRDLPTFLKQRYSLCRGEIAGQRFTAILLNRDSALQPAVFEKHLHQLPVYPPDWPLLVASSLPAYVRKRLVQMRIPFVVPGVQLYWPDLGMVVRDRGRRPALNVEILSPSTQALILYALVGKLSAPPTPRQLTEVLPYSAMTMTRAFDEIEATGLGKTARAGRERLLYLPESRSDLWESAKPRMQSPVQKSLNVWSSTALTEQLLLAGECALAELTMLAPPTASVYAIGQRAWNQIQARYEEPALEGDADSIVLQVWRYDPRPLAQQKRVDPYSLYLSLLDTQDERVEGALEYLQEKHLW